MPLLSEIRLNNELENELRTLLSKLDFGETIQAAVSGNRHTLYSVFKDAATYCIRHPLRRRFGVRS